MSQKKKIALAAVILVVIIAAVAIVLAINGRKESGKTADNKDSSTTQQDSALLGTAFSDPQAGVTVRVPKDWQLAPKSDKNPGSLTKFQHTQSRANGELTTVKSNASMDDVVRGYLEGAINIDYKTELVKHESVVVGDKPARLVVQDIPGPDGQTARLTQYFFSKDGSYFILSYTVLASDWETLRPGIEASAASLEMK